MVTRHLTPNERRARERAAAAIARAYARAGLHAPATTDSGDVTDLAGRYPITPEVAHAIRAAIDTDSSPA